MPRFRVDKSPQRRRVVAYLRAILPYVVMFMLLSLYLSAYFLLSQVQTESTHHELGWQAWDEIRPVSEAQGQLHSTSGDKNIPLDVWNPFAKHTTGLTEIAIVSCLLSPSILTFCWPYTTPELDKAKGKWVLVDSDLNHRTGLTALYLFYRRTRRQDVDLVTDMQLATRLSGRSLERDGWTKARGNLRAGVWPTQTALHLWYKTASQASMSDLSGIVTEITPHYGDSAPFFGFQRARGGKVMDAKVGAWESVDIVYRRGNPTAPVARTPKFNGDGTFKIMQIADLHYSVGHGYCRDTNKSPCTGDPDTAAWLGEALDLEQPDMVVFSGDQLNGQKTSYSSMSVLAKFASEVIERQIPWAAVFGNHDSEIADDRKRQMEALESMPYSMSLAGPPHVDGVGNYVIRLLSPDPSMTHIFTLYFLDSHSYQRAMLPYPLSHPDYDYIKTSQIVWFLNVSSSVLPIERPFRPDGGKDLGKVWSKRRLDSDLRQRTLAKPNAMMFFHIPLPEAYFPADVSTDDEELSLGEMFDKAGSSKHNGNFFSQAIEKSFEYMDEDGTRINEVKALSHGHCHNTDRCRRVRGVWMCFDGGSSYSGYGQLGFERRVRLYTVSDWGETITTYKRLVSGQIIDRQTLVGNGAAPGWGHP